MTALTLAESPAPEGHNNPPAPTPFEAIKAHLDDLLLEARNWADGVAVETQAQADEVSRLMEDLRKGGDAADDARIVEKKPHDDVIEEIQSRWNAYIGGLRSKVRNPGKVVVALQALTATLEPYLQRLKAEKDAIAAKARQEAQDAADKAAAAMRAADASNLAAREAAEALVEEARLAQSAATRAANDKAHALGGSRAKGLTTTWTPVMVSAKDALSHYVKTQPDEIKACLLRLAEQDVRTGKRKIPGFEVQEGTRL